MFETGITYRFEKLNGKYATVKCEVRTEQRVRFRYNGKIYWAETSVLDGTEYAYLPIHGVYTKISSNNPINSFITCKWDGE